MINQQPVCLSVPKINMNIQIVRSSILSLSSMSHVSAMAILEVLKRNYINADITIVDNVSDLKSLVGQKPDIIFLGMQYVLDENNHKIWLSDFLDNAGIPYTGSTQSAHRLEMNKHKAKQTMINAGIQTSPFLVAKRNDDFGQCLDNLTFPMFVKPTSQGGGVGIDASSVVNNIDELIMKIS